MNKLVVKLGNAGLAQKLAEAGYDNPRKIRDASDEELLDIDGIGPVGLSVVRAKLPVAPVALKAYPKVLEVPEEAPEVPKVKVLKKIK